MEPFKAIQEPDEGYSEHPLYPSGTSGNGSSTALTGVQSHADLPAWLSTQLPNLSISQKTHLAMLILNELPTTVIADIVMNNLNPRLYINFVEYLPPEICLKIFGYLDPVSLIHVAMCCRGWYNLAVDRKLWEKLYYLEGWKALHAEITAAEQRMNESASYAQLQHQRLQSVDGGHIHKKRAVSEISIDEDDGDLDMVDVDQIPKQEPRDAEMAGSSLFGGPQLGGSGSSAKSNTSMVLNMGNLVVNSPSPMSDRGGNATAKSAKGKGRATGEYLSTKDASDAAKGLSRLSKPSLWIYDSRDERYKISWKWLYTMRRRLESNWDRGRFTNFQLPHPDHLEEGHNECIYSLQYNSEYLVSGSRDKTIRIWNLHTRRLIRPPLKEHTGSVLCLQFDSDPQEDLIVSGSSDSDVILWRFSTGQVIQRLQKAHKESVLNVKFDKRILVTCSKDKTIKIFNRHPLRPGDLGYGDIGAVSPVPINLDYGYGSPLDNLPIKPAYTMIGCLEGHGAAVNAVQICDEEIVSASGDRHIKVWDWPNQICRRTFLGHNKGIACVQYDGRRIVSGSSDNEVKVFDRETGLEVASLRAHANLVRTVQAGFGDLPYSKEEDRLEAKKVDDDYFAAKEAGRLEELERLRDRPRNAGSRRPEDITAFGAKLPPGGGGGPYGRIVSGSYDQTIMIWRRDRDGIWKNVHTLRQEEGAANALRRPRGAATTVPRIPSPLDNGLAATQSSRAISQAPASSASAPPILPQQAPSYTHVEQPIHATITPQTTSSYTQMIDTVVTQGPTALSHALAAYPTMLTYHSHIQGAIDREPDAMTRSQLREVVNAALVRTQIAQTRAMSTSQQSLTNPTESGDPGPSSRHEAQTWSLSNNVAARRAAIQALTGRSSAQVPAAPSAYYNSAQPGADASSSRSSNNATSSRQAEPGSNSVAGSSTGAGSSPSTTLHNTQQQPAQQPPTQPQTQGQARVYHPQQQHPQPPLAQTHPQPIQPAAVLTAAAVQAQQQQQQHHHPHIPQGDATNPARIFKLQFDACRIICCSQTSTIVGWDFCNNDPELEEASRFFGTVE